MGKYDNKADVLLAKANSLYKIIVGQRVSVDLGLAIKNQVPFDNLSRESQLTICKIAIEWEKQAKTIDAEAEAEKATALAEMKPDDVKAEEADKAKTEETA